MRLPRALEDSEEAVLKAEPPNFDAEPPNFEAGPEVVIFLAADVLSRTYNGVVVSTTTGLVHIGDVEGSIPGVCINFWVR